MSTATSLLDVPENAPIPDVEQGAKESEELARATCVLELDFKALSFSKKVESERVAPDGTNPAFISVMKALIDKKNKDFKAIGQHRAKFKRWLQMSIALESTFLRSGQFLIPLSKSDEVWQKWKEFKADDEFLVGKFVEKYEDIAAASTPQLGELSDRGELPTRADVERSFRVYARYITLNVPAALEDRNRELYAELAARSEAEWAEMKDEIRDGLRAGFIGLIEKATNRLGVDPATGKPRIFRDSMVTQLTDFLETFEARNLTNDGELAELAKKARDLISGRSADEIRKQGALRESLAKGFEEIKAKMDTMGTMQGRKFSLVEEDE